MWFPIVKQPLEWGPTAPGHFSNQVVLDAAPAEVFAILADNDQWPRWFRGMKAVSWVSGAGGLGSRREVQLDIISFREEFLAWEPGRRFAFAMVEGSLPLFVSAQEDFRLEALPHGRTAMSWDMNFQLHWFARLVEPVLRRRLGRMMSSAADALVEHVRAAGVWASE